MRVVRSRSSQRLFCAVAWAMVLAGCGSADIVNLEFGGLTVDTITTGTNVDPNAYNLEVTGPGLNVEQTIGVNDRVVFSVTPGAYTVRLGDVAANCASGTNPLNVTVISGSAASAVFRVECT